MAQRDTTKRNSSWSSRRLASLENKVNRLGAAVLAFSILVTTSMYSAFRHSRRRVFPVSCNRIGITEQVLIKSKAHQIGSRKIFSAVVVINNSVSSLLLTHFY
jgi:hypothetical protein